MNLITEARVRVFPSPLSVPTIQACAHRLEWQVPFVGPLPPPKILRQKAKSSQLGNSLRATKNDAVIDSLHSSF